MIDEVASTHLDCPTKARLRPDGKVASSTAAIAHAAIRAENHFSSQGCPRVHYCLCGNSVSQGPYWPSDAVTADGRTLSGPPTRVPLAPDGTPAPFAHVSRSRYSSLSLS